MNSSCICERKLDLLLNFGTLVGVVSLQACPEEVISIDSIRAAMGVGLVPNNQRQKLEEKAAADEKTAPEPLGENSLVFMLFIKYRDFTCHYRPFNALSFLSVFFNTSDGECFVRLFIVSRSQGLSIIHSVALFLFVCSIICLLLYLFGF